LNFSPHISITIKSTTAGWDGHVACSEQLNNVYDASVTKAVGNLKETQF
jgi:hypothetical protein